MPTPAEKLVEAVGQDAAVSVLLWLDDLYDEHALEVEDGRLISPSVEWLKESLRDGLLPTPVTIRTALTDGEEGAT